MVTIYKLEHEAIGNGAIAVINDSDEVRHIPRKWAGGYCYRANLEELPHTAWGDEAEQLWDLSENFKE